MDEIFPPRDYQDTSLGWQAQQATQQFSEWIEAQWSAVQPDAAMPQVTPPDWLLRTLFIMIIGGLLGWLGWQLYREFAPQIQAWLGQEAGRRRPARPPQTPVYSAETWVRQARQAQQAGDYREACRCLYMAMLSQLSAQDIIRLEASRTDGEYRALLLTMADPAPYYLLLAIHEQLCFSSQGISAAEWERCWAAYQDLPSP
ncbi:MAG: DUF4129 domain-containing protein [Leptolyngbya sp. DLM2.Bin15]|nr:MAG: DUF4129 domain-containing protein [Leptolyngbya sp. DLM2.Bin15]